MRYKQQRWCWGGNEERFINHERHHMDSNGVSVKVNISPKWVCSRLHEQWHCVGQPASQWSALHQDQDVVAAWTSNSTYCYFITATFDWFWHEFCEISLPFTIGRPSMVTTRLRPSSSWSCNSNVAVKTTFLIRLQSSAALSWCSPSTLHQHQETLYWKVIANESLRKFVLLTWMSDKVKYSPRAFCKSTYCSSHHCFHLF